jgi:hypothetical protein
MLKSSGLGKNTVGTLPVFIRPNYQPPTAPDALKKQQMQWSKKGAHRLLQTRTRTLDGTLHDLFTSWYPAMPANDVQPASFAAAA